MKNFEIKTVYGPHISRCFGLSLGIDPILFPKRCPYNCIYCPIGKTVVKTNQPKFLVDIDRILRDLNDFIQVNGCIFETIFVWGMGDPLLNYQIPIIIEKINEILEKARCEARIIVRTTGFNLDKEWINGLCKYVDEIIVPLDNPTNYWRIYNDPLRELSFNDLIRILREINQKFKSKIRLEINLFRTNEYTNASKEVLLELIGFIAKTRIKKVYLKTVNRPSYLPNIKPVKGKRYESVVRLFEDRGLSVKRCVDQTNVPQIIVSDHEIRLLNHLIRKPLSTNELIKLYGSKSLSLIEDLVEKDYVEKVNWEGRIYFRIKKLPLNL